MKDHTHDNTISHRTLQRGGNICCHPTNPDIMYASFPVSGVHQIHQMDRVSAGVWTPTQLTLGLVPSFRPDTSTGVLTFVRGTYTDYEIFPECRIMGMLIA